MINTALVREYGPDTDRLIAIVDDDNRLIRFESGPYNHPAKD